MRDRSLKTLVGVMVVVTMFFGCGDQSSSEFQTELQNDVEGMISLEDAETIALSVGVNPELVIYSDMLPYVISANEAMSTWGFIEQVEEKYLVTYIDDHTGDIIEARSPAGDNILDFINNSQGTIKGTQGTGTNTYDSFPWNWRLPMDGGTFTMTCGYGCYKHTGSIYYSTDWANGTTGKLLESPASCWVKYTSYSSSYGNQIIAECGNAGSGKRYYYRLAHMRDSSMVVPGWWIAKGRGVGYLGNTGSSTGAHVHIEMLRATSTSGGTFSGQENLPISKWPGSGDSVCGNQFAGYNFTGQPGYSFNFNSEGCR
ncbi:MAG: peptidoglycan DD-metalloendopeptidase family protein [Patescibacteria group bacterium]